MPFLSTFFAVIILPKKYIDQTIYFLDNICIAFYYKLKTPKFVEKFLERLFL